uniref:HMG box domain-containing protein n=1 Tax=Pygocentrus nattereri TaxID=42514 RepID=A0A3B4CCG1_PYGNA
MKDIKSRWSSLGEDERNKYIQEARELKAQEQADQLNSEMRKLKIRKHLKQLKVEMSKLEELGLETAPMIFDCLNPQAAVHELASKKASEFIESTGTGNKFWLHFADIITNLITSMEPVPVLVRKAGGTGRLPVCAAHRIMIEVTSLPNDLPLKQPCLYGRQQLAATLQHAKSISSQIIVTCFYIHLPEILKYYFSSFMLRSF